MRYGPYKPEELSNEEWVRILGPDVNNLEHLKITLAITNDFIAPSGFTVQQAILKEESDSPYANLIVVREQDKKNPAFEKLIEVMHSQSVVQETEKIFPNGAAIKAW